MLRDPAEIDTIRTAIKQLMQHRDTLDTASERESIETTILDLETIIEEDVSGLHAELNDDESTTDNAEPSLPFDPEPFTGTEELRQEIIDAVEKIFPQRDTPSVSLVVHCCTGETSASREETQSVVAEEFTFDTAPTGETIVVT